MHTRSRVNRGWAVALTQSCRRAFLRSQACCRAKKRTNKWEKRAIALEIPEWDPALCIQCNKCVLVCPHAAIRAKWYPAPHLTDAPKSFKAVDFRSNDHKGAKYSLQVAPEDCTGCTLC